jgi:hypothetical protein
MSRTEDLVKAAQAESEATRDEPYPADAKGQRPHRAEAIAEEHEIPVGALIRGWVLRAVAAERDLTLADAVDRLAADVDRLRRLAHNSAA